MTLSLSPDILPPPHRTPLIRTGAIWMKPEGQQRTGSVKYRLVYAKVQAALAAGQLDPQSVLTEVTSGSTGVALAYVGALLGLRVTVHAYANACPHKCAQIRAYGAALHFHPLDTPMTELLGQVARQVEQGGYWHLNQYYRPANLLAYQALGEEVVEQFHILGGPPPQFFACSVGTGGLIQGMGTCLRRAFPGIQIVAVEPEPQTTIPGIRNTQTLYLGQDDPYDRHFPDLRRTILPPEHQAQVAGIRLGDSATAVYHAILQAAWDNALFIAPD